MSIFDDLIESQGITVKHVQDVLREARQSRHVLTALMRYDLERAEAAEGTPHHASHLIWHLATQEELERRFGQ